MTRKTKKIYKTYHKISKTIVCIMVIILLITSKFFTFPVSSVFEAIAVAVWFFGVNPTAYILESIMKVKHTHDTL